MSLPIISSQLCYSHVYDFDAMLIACRSQFRRHLGLYKEYTWICSKTEVEAFMFVNGDNSKTNSDLERWYFLKGTLLNTWPPTYSLKHYL